MHPRYCIVLIAYTNHALDHMVTSVLDAEITQKIVRLGTRSSDERISEYTLDKLERLATAPTLDRSIKRQYGVMKRLEEEMTNTMTSIRLPLLAWSEIEKYLDIHYPEHADSFRAPPFWIAEFAKLKWMEEEQEGEFQEVKHGKKGKNQQTVVDSSVSRTLYGFWRQALDLQFVQQKPIVNPPQANKGKGKEKEKERVQANAAADLKVTQFSLLTDPPAFFASLGFGGQTPPVPSQNRPLEPLLRFANVWAMSAHERTRLAAEWEKRIRNMAYTSKVDQYTRLKAEYKEACKEYDEMRDEVRSPCSR